VYRVAGISPPRAFETYRETFARTAASFRPLRREERERMTEVRLRPRPARAGESIAAFVTRTGGIWKADQTAVANGIAADAGLEAGFAMKVPIRQRMTVR
jgi:predicted Zn-dependent protease